MRIAAGAPCLFRRRGNLYRNRTTADDECAFFQGRGLGDALRLFEEIRRDCLVRRFLRQHACCGKHKPAITTNSLIFQLPQRAGRIDWGYWVRSLLRGDALRANFNRRKRSSKSAQLPSAAAPNEMSIVAANATVASTEHNSPEGGAAWNRERRTARVYTTGYFRRPRLTSTKAPQPTEGRAETSLARDSVLIPTGRAHLDLRLRNRQTRDPAEIWSGAGFRSRCSDRLVGGPPLNELTECACRSCSRGRCPP